METNKEEIIEKEAKKSDELYSALIDTLYGKDFVMSTPAFITALAKFLSDMSDIAEKFGTDREIFMKSLMLATKKVDMLKDSQNN